MNSTCHSCISTDIKNNIKQRVFEKQEKIDYTNESAYEFN